MGDSRVQVEGKSSSTLTPGFKPEESSFLKQRYQDRVEEETISSTAEKQFSTSGQATPTPPPSDPPPLSYSFGRMSVRPIQAKLTIGQQNDKYEQEADRVAEQVMRMPDPRSPAAAITRPVISPVVQRLCTECEEDLQRQPLEEGEDEEKMVQAKRIAGLTTPIIQRQRVDSEENEEDTLQMKPLANQITPLIQRQSESSEEEEEETVQTKPVSHSFGRVSVLPIQAKLRIGQSNDKYEQEADRVAEQVMRMPDPRSPAVAITRPVRYPVVQRLCTECEEELQRQPLKKEEEEEMLQAKRIAGLTTPIIQRQGVKSEEEEEEQTVQAKENLEQASSVTSNLEARLHSSKGSGQPLPEQTRSFMESRFGHDFSQVQVHANGEAARLNRDLRAQAFTHGQDVYFRSGKYSPESREGKQLLAHELTHVVQQTSGNASSHQTKTRLPVKKISSRIREKVHLDFSTNGIIQKKGPKNLTRPIYIRFKKPLTGDEFKQHALSQLGITKKVKWKNVRKHYKASDSPVEVLVAVSLLKKSRSIKTASDLGLDVDDAGRIAGADERADEFSKIPYGWEKKLLFEEIDRRYCHLKGMPEGCKIKDPKKDAIWNQIRDEVLAERAFIKNLPEKVRHIIYYSEGGIVITPKNYRKVVRIANQIKKLDAADLENYLSKVKETKDLDALENRIDKFLRTKEAAPEKIKELMKKVSDDDWDTDSEASKLDANAMFYMPLDQRIKVIKSIAGGYLVGNEDETTIIRLLSSTPSKDINALIDELKKNNSALLKKLESVIDSGFLSGSETKEYHAALRNIIFKSLDIEETKKKLENAKIFPWADKWLSMVRFYYDVEYTKEGKIRVKYWTNSPVLGQGIGNPERILEPDEIIGLYFVRDEDFANASKGQTIFMPAANLLAFEDEQFSRELGLVVDVALLFSGGLGLVAKGTRVAKAIRVLEVALSTADLTINLFRSEIAKTKAGKQFLKAWDIVNTLIGVYGLAKVVVSLPETFRNLKKAYQNFKGDPGKISPDDIAKIDNDTTKLFQQADKAVFENEIADLRKRFSADEMTTFEKQLENISGIADSRKRKAALATIENKLSKNRRFKEWKASLSEGGQKQFNSLSPQQQRFWEEMDPSVRELLTLCRSDCIPPNVPPDIEKQIRDLVKKTSGLSIEHEGLREFLHAHAQNKNIQGGLNEIKGFTKKSDLEQYFDQQLIKATHLKKGVTPRRGSGGLWEYPRADGSVVKEHEIGSHSYLTTNRGTDHFFESHHGIQDLWARTRLGKYYSKGKAKTILLRSRNLKGGSSGTAHGVVNNLQKKRKVAKEVEMRSYLEERQNCINDLGKEAGVPKGTIDKYMKEVDEYFGGIYRELSKSPSGRKLRDKVFGSWTPP